MPQTNGEGNVILTPDDIAKEALVLLKNNLVFAPLVWRNLEREFGEKGQTINVRLPPRVKSAEGRHLQIQPEADQTTPFTINRHRHVGLQHTQRDLELSMGAFSQRYLKSGVTQLANVVDKSIADEIKLKTFYGSGTPGTAITKTDFFLGEAYMMGVGVPLDGMNQAVMNPLDKAGIQDGILTLDAPEIVKSALQRGYMGPISNFECYASANLSHYTVGAHAGTPLVNGASQTGSSLITDGWGGTSSLNAGDCFTIDNVFEVNPQTYASTGRLQRFVVLADIEDDVGGNMTISISPAINDGTLTTTDENGDVVSLAAYQNVTAAPANNAAITVIGTASTTYRQNLLFHKNACALAMIQISRPEGAVEYATAYDDDTGLAICYTAGYDIMNFQSIKRLDVLWGTKLIYPELSHRLWSDNV